MKTDNFNNYSRYYDLLYKDKDYAAETEYIKGLLQSLQPQGTSILELGCGTGTHAALLCKSGFTVTGLERSIEMVTIAKAKNIDGLSIVSADIAHFDLSQKFDVAISLFHVISYLTLNDSLISCFKSTSNHLHAGGIFIFDVWYSPAVYLQKPDTRVKRMADEVIDIIRIAEPEIFENENVVDVNYEIIIRNKSTQVSETHKEKHRMRHFSIPEIELLASQTNFKLIRSEEFVTAKQPGANTWGVCFILQKQ